MKLIKQIVVEKDDGENVVKTTTSTWVEDQPSKVDKDTSGVATLLAVSFSVACVIALIVALIGCLK